MTNSLKQHIISFVVIITGCCMTPAAAQESTLMHFMRSSPQSLRSNPAMLDDAVTSFYGVPFFSNIGAEAYLPVTWNDVITRNPLNDSLYLNKNLPDKFLNSSDITVDVSYELFSFGKRFNEIHMLSFSLGVKGFGTLDVPKDAVIMLIEGNHPGETLSAHSDVNAALYAEAAVGYSLVMDKYIKIGMRVKYLAGIVGGYGRDMYWNATTDPEDYTLRMTSNGLLQTSMPGKGEKINPFSNSGVGLDAGLYYTSPIRGLDFSVSFIDWGYIQWNSNLHAYQSRITNTEHTYTGLPFTNLRDLDFDAIKDSLKHHFQYKQVDSSSSFASPLPGKIFLGASYNCTKHDKLAFLFSTRALHKFDRTTLSLMYSHTFGETFTVAVGNNFTLSPHLFSPSLGINMRRGKFQWHLIVENLSSVYVKHLRAANIQIGFNIIKF